MWQIRQPNEPQPENSVRGCLTNRSLAVVPGRLRCVWLLVALFIGLGACIDSEAQIGDNPQEIATIVKNDADSEDSTGDLSASSDAEVDSSDPVSDSPVECTPSNCGGCCNEAGKCMPGDTERACGTGGRKCVSCPSKATCQNGECIDDSPDGPLCVQGTPRECRDTGEQWSPGAIECCVEDASVCTEGDERGCDDDLDGIYWTGTVCCLKHASKCVAGTGSRCADVGVWTGSKCCVNHTGTCTSGESWECTDPNESWTGELCCIAGNPICTDGTDRACEGPDEQWTGTRCCVQNVSSCEVANKNDCRIEGKHWTGTKCCE